MLTPLFEAYVEQLCHPRGFEVAHTMMIPNADETLAKADYFVAKGYRSITLFITLVKAQESVYHNEKIISLAATYH